MKTRKEITSLCKTSINAEILKMISQMFFILKHKKCSSVIRSKSNSESDSAFKKNKKKILRALVYILKWMSGETPLEL